MTFRRPFFIPLFAVVLLGLLAGCGDEAKQPQVDKSVDDRFPIKVGDQVVQMQVAALPNEMQKGLMFVKAMGENDGMVFVFDAPQPMGFWMRNTLIPLDIGYLDADGTLQEIYPMYPHDERSVRSVAKRQLALEMNQGWYARHGVKPGAKLEMKALVEALRARGLKPENYGLK